MSTTLPKIEAVFNKLIPTVPFDYQFVDEDYASKFPAEERIGKLAGFFTLLAVYISCLDLFGLASFVAEQRAKEVSIRKVLGASVFNLWSLLSNKFTALVLLSLLIAVPLAYYFMHLWLQDNSYRTTLSWWIFLLAGLGAILISLVTVSYQTICAAVKSPVGVLRGE
jgi:ABC-type antimicrobial peptide transport system permease subunit